MKKDDETLSLRKKALEISNSNPQQALDLLIKTMHEYSDTWTVVNLVCDDVIMWAKYLQRWDVAIEACNLSAKLRPDYRVSILDEARACQLDKEGKHIEAIDARVANIKKPGPFYTGRVEDFVPLYTDLRAYGDIYTNLNEHDRAWRL